MLNSEQIPFDFEGVTVGATGYGATTEYYLLVEQKNYGAPSDHHLQYEDVYFESSDGTKLHGWHIKTKADSSFKDKAQARRMRLQSSEMKTFYESVLALYHSREKPASKLKVNLPR